MTLLSSTLRQAANTEIAFTVPMTPVSVNHYKKPIMRKGKFIGFYVTKEAKAFKEAVAICCRQKQVRSDRYSVSFDIFLGKGQKGDLDNFAKVLLDSLVDAEVIDSDAKVTILEMSKDRDEKNPRTDITVRTL